MKKYIAVAKILFKAQFAYRFDVFMTALGTIWRVIFAWILWGAIFMGRDEVGGFTFDAMLTYYVISSFLTTMDMSGDVAGEISSRVKAGSFSRFMVIPSNPQIHFLSQTLGASGYYGIFAVLAAIAGVCLFNINLTITTDPFNILLGIVLFVLGVIFMNGFQFFVGIWAFKFQDIGFLLHTYPSVISFFKGEFVPLSLLSPAFVDILQVFPFTHVAYTPTMLFTGRMDYTQGLTGLAVLALWTAGMAALNQATYNRLRKKYEGVGI